MSHEGERGYVRCSYVQVSPERAKVKGNDVPTEVPECILYTRTTCFGNFDVVEDMTRPVCEDAPKEMRAVRVSEDTSTLTLGLNPNAPI